MISTHLQPRNNTPCPPMHVRVSQEPHLLSLQLSTVLTPQADLRAAVIWSVGREVALVGSSPAACSAACSSRGERREGWRRGSGVTWLVGAGGALVGLSPSLLTAAAGACREGGAMPAGMGCGAGFCGMPSRVTRSGRERGGGQALVGVVNPCRAAADAHMPHTKPATPHPHHTLQLANSLSTSYPPPPLTMMSYSLFSMMVALKYASCMG